MEREKERKLLLGLLGDVGLDLLRDDAAADGTLAERPAALRAAHQVTTGDEHHADVSVHTDLALLLPLKPLENVAWVLFCNKDKSSTYL